MSCAALQRMHSLAENLNPVLPTRDVRKTVDLKKLCAGNVLRIRSALCGHGMALCARAALRQAVTDATGRGDQGKCGKGEK